MPFLGEHLDWCPPGHPMLAAVDLGHPRLTGLAQLGPGGVVAAQVGVGGHQVGLGDPHRRLAAAFGLRVRRHTRRHRDPVVATDRDDLRMAHSDPSDVIDRDRALVVGEPIRRSAAEGSHRPIHTGDHRRQSAIPARHHHPEPRPRQPRTKQIRPSPGDDRTGAPVPLRPHPRLGDPRPIHPPPATAMVGLHLSDRSAHRAVRTRKPQRLQLVEGPVGADLGVRPLDPLLDLRHPRIDDPLPAHRAHTPQPTLVALSDITGHSVMRHTGQLTGATQRPTQVERFQHVHDSSRDFTCSSHSMATVVVTGHSSRRSTPPRWTPTGNGLQRGQLCWPPLGRTVGCQRAATWPPLGRTSWPPTRVARLTCGYGGIAADVVVLRRQMVAPADAGPTRRSVRSRCDVRWVLARQGSQSNRWAIAARP